jgi:hypothetical protein
MRGTKYLLNIGLFFLLILMIFIAVFTVDNALHCITKYNYDTFSVKDGTPYCVIVDEDGHETAVPRWELDRIYHDHIR